MYFSILISKIQNKYRLIKRDNIIDEKETERIKEVETDKSSKCGKNDNFYVERFSNKLP